MFVTNLATLTILALGGRFVIRGSMTLGDFTAFNSYLAILIFPVILIGFMSNVMAQASASYKRIGSVLARRNGRRRAAVIADLRGDIELSHVVGEVRREGRAEGRVAVGEGGNEDGGDRPDGRRQDAAAVPADRPAGADVGQRRVDGRQHRRLRQGDAAPAGRLRVPGRDDVQPDAAGEHRASARP